MHADDGTGLVRAEVTGLTQPQTQKDKMFISCFAQNKNLNSEQQWQGRRRYWFLYMFVVMDGIHWLRLNLKKKKKSGSITYKLSSSQTYK